MPLPRWLAQINKRVFNKLELRKGVRPVLVHVGRTSGKTYETPLEAFPVDQGYIFILMYGSRSDWVKNILSSGSAELRIDGHQIELTSPRVVTGEEEWRRLPPTQKRPPGFMGVSELLRMDARS